MDAEEVVFVDGPIFLLMSPAPCWKCNADNLVIALASKRVRCSDPYANEIDVPILLSNIEEMPKEIADYLTSYHPPFQKRHSKMAEYVYYANTCSQCGANFGDFFLFSEPEGPFCPINPEGAEEISIAELPFKGTFEVSLSVPCRP